MSGTRCVWFGTGVLGLWVAGAVGQEGSLPGTGPLGEVAAEERSEAMVAGVARFLDRQTEQAAAARGERWRRDFASREAYEQSVTPRRERLARMIGAVEARVPEVELWFEQSTRRSSLVAETAEFRVDAVRWPVVPGLEGEGLLVRPAGPPRARVVVIPDAGETPEALVGIGGESVANPFVQRIVRAGCEVVVPVLISRDDRFSGNERVGRWTNQPHREWIYRQSFELGRHVIGYEVEKVRALVDWFAGQDDPLPVGIAGFHEGGLLALHAAALDSRVDAALVSGYFAPREGLWEEPIYRNLQGFLLEFGDAELATLVAPRTLVIEPREGPRIDGPPAPREGRAGAAPGRWSPPTREAARGEWERATALLAGAPADWKRAELAANAADATTRFLAGLGLGAEGLEGAVTVLAEGRTGFDAEERQERQVRQMENHLQGILRHCAAEREKAFWKPLAASPEAVRAEWTTRFRDEIIGWFDDPRLPLRARSRELLREERWTGHEVMLDVWEDVDAWGYLLVPHDLRPGERRPVVVCQHGLEGLPGHLIERDGETRAWKAYKAFAAVLADRGFIVFVPHNPYRGGTAFRDLQRRLNPLGRSLFSVIGRQHEAILDWLEAQTFVDPARIGFYGLSYGGKSAMRQPVLEPRYALSICSGDFNEWVWKNATVDWRGSYVYAPEHEIFEWDLGHTTNYAEMAALISPRPFMVERGHHDGVGTDEWVAFEYAKVRRHYVALGIGDRTEIEWFDGPHTIHGEGSYAFLHRHLGWPEPETPPPGR